MHLVDYYAHAYPGECVMDLQRALHHKAGGPLPPICIVSGIGGQMDMRGCPAETPWQHEEQDPLCMAHTHPVGVKTKQYKARDRISDTKIREGTSSGEAIMSMVVHEPVHHCQQWYKCKVAGMTAGTFFERN